MCSREAVGSLRGIAVALVAAVSVAACSGGDDPELEPARGDGRQLSGSVAVFAAASLTEPFEAIAAEFEDERDVDVELNFAGSQQLVAQIEQGAPADVLATADEESMAAAREKGLTQGRARAFASNTLALVVAKDNPENIQALVDLERRELLVAIAAEEVPVGRYTREVFEAAGVTVRPATEELNVKAVLTKVALGEADAGIVYTSDIASSADVEQVEIPDDVNVEAEYLIAAVGRSQNRAAARAFISFVFSEVGRDHLEAAGFEVL